MKIAEIQIGGRYEAKVSGQFVVVRVLAVREVPPAWHGGTRWRQLIDAVNERTGRRLTLRSAQRLRRAIEPGKGG